jgi:hypothetical protein
MKRSIGIGLLVAVVCSLAATAAWAARQGNQRGVAQTKRDRVRLAICQSSSEGSQVVTGAATANVAPTAIQRRIQDRDRLSYPGNGRLTQEQKRANYLAQKAAAKAAYQARKAAAQAAYQAQRQTRTQTRTQDPANCPYDCSGDRQRDQDRDRLHDQDRDRLRDGR